MKLNSLRELYVEQLHDLYDAENQIIKALPKMIGECSSEELREALEEHLEITRQQATRLEKLFNQLGEKTKSQKCKGMEGVIKEGSELLSEVGNEAVKDAAIIAAAQRVEHYEMAGYGTARTYANLLNEPEAAALLEQTLEEEKEADSTLTEIAEQVNVEAESGEGEEEAAPGKRTTKAGGRRQKRVA